MDMPKVSAQQKRLSALFAGTWRGEEKLYPSQWDPKGGPAFATWVVTSALDGFYLLVDYTEERDGKVVYRGHGVHAWDAAEGSFLSYWFDNIGVVQKSPNRAKLEGSTYGYISSGGPMGHSRFTYAFEGDRLDFTIDTSPDGSAWKPMHEGRYTRQK